MPELYDGVNVFSQLTKALVPEEWLTNIWPKYKIFSYRALERGVGGHPILLPKLLWPYPRRDVPMFYMTLSIDTQAFVLGFLVGTYLACANKYITRDLKFVLTNYIYFDKDGLEVGGTPKDWMYWVYQDRYRLLKTIRRALPYAFGGGLLHCWNYYWYRVLMQAEGHMVPMLVTCVVMTVGDREFMINHRQIGNACYFAVGCDFLRQLFLGGNSTFFTFHFLKKYFGNPFCFVIYPPSWLMSVMPR